MRKLIYIICIVFFTQSVFANEKYDAANKLYESEEYEQAITAYNSILSTNVQSSDLYYNLGNSYYKTGDFPNAILNYERAKLLKPHDKDIEHNLNLVNSQIADKIETQKEFFLVAWYNSFKNSSSSDTWATFSLIFIFVTCVFVGVFIFFKQRNIKQLSFFAAILTLAMFFICFSFSSSQKHRLNARDTAIIFTPTISVKSSPSEQGKELFMLHEGAKVKIKDTLNDWTQVQIADGSEGWLPTNVYEII